MRALAVLLFLSQPVLAAEAKTVTLKSSLLDQLKTTHDQQDWFVPVKPAIDGVTAAQAVWKPQGGDHSIGQLANHLLFWNSQNLAKLKGVAAPKFDGNNDETFNAFDQAKWDQVRKDLDRVLTELEKLVERADEKTLQKWAPTLGRIATHNAYHTGQILVLRKMQGAWDPSKGVK
ncbi:MAG TPA: DinB family protein [Myxococcaceae bacterium]|nr:DinB family protein [Myxococcaceae bacterium]